MDNILSVWNMGLHKIFAVILAGIAAILLIGPRRLWPRSGVKLLPLPDSAETLFGHERIVFMSQPGSAFRKWISSLGRTFRIKAAFGAPDIVVLTDRAGIHHILQKRIFDYHHSGVVRPRVARFLGKGLGWVEGSSEHKRMKGVVGPSLTSDNVRAISPEMRDAATRVINDMETHLLAGNQPRDLNILEWTGKIALNVVGHVSFMHDFDGGNSPDAQIILNAKGKGAQPVARFAGFIVLMLLRRFTFLNWVPIPAISAQGAVRQVIDNEVTQEIIKRNQGFVTDGKDLLSQLLRANLPREELYAHVSTFIIAGHEATTLTLGYSIFEMARNPETQKRLREELMDFPGEPTFEDYVNKLPYLDAVLKETLRLYPGLPYMERVATKHDVIPLKQPIHTKNGKMLTELVVEPGQTILIPIIAIHRMDSLWNDPDTFRPERWLEKLPHVEELPDGWANLLAFSDGPRSCIGARFAIHNYKIILTALMKQFKFSDTGVEISLKIASSLQPWVVGKEGEGVQLPIKVEVL